MRKLYNGFETIYIFLYVIIKLLKVCFLTFSVYSVCLCKCVCVCVCEIVNHSWLRKNVVFVSRSTVSIFCINLFDKCLPSSHSSTHLFSVSYSSHFHLLTACLKWCVCVCAVYVRVVFNLNIKCLRLGLIRERVL